MKPKTVGEAVALKRPGPIWIFRVAGGAIVLFGAYIAGGDELTCAGVAPASTSNTARANPPVAECRLETRRWLGQSVVDRSRYPGVTKAETIMVRPSGQDAEDAWYVQLLAGEREVGRVFVSRERVQAGADRLRAWFEGDRRDEVRVEWSTRGFGYAAMAFGLVVLVVISRARR